MSTNKLRSDPDCPSCVSGKGDWHSKHGEIVAIKDANACNDNPKCPCDCHKLWAQMQADRRPIGQP